MWLAESVNLPNRNKDDERHDYEIDDALEEPAIGKHRSFRGFGRPEIAAAGVRFSSVKIERATHGDLHAISRSKAI